MGGSLYIFRRDAFFQLFRFVCVCACTRVWCFVPMCDVYKRVGVSACVPEQVTAFSSIALCLSDLRQGLLLNQILAVLARMAGQ